MTNERLVEIKTPMYMDASKVTLDEFIKLAKRQIEERIITLYSIAHKEIEDECNTEQQKVLKKSLYTTAFYDIFKYYGKMSNKEKMFPIYKFKVNPKNINFETCLTDLKEWYEEMTITPEVSCNPKSLRFIKDIPEWKNLFGKGEFPYMTIYAFRLGNTEYFAYEIHR